MDTPVIFSDGTEVYERLGREYIRHKRGLFILAPSGTGKTYCEKCKTEMGKKTSRRGEVVTDTFLCPKYGFTFKEKLDLRVTEEMPGKYWETDKARFLFDEKRGKNYIEEKQHLASMGDIKALLDDFNEHEVNKKFTMLWLRFRRLILVSLRRL